MIDNPCNDFRGPADPVQEPDIEIIIPTYNRCDDLRVLVHRIIVDVLEAGLGSIVLTISDNWSTDGTAALLEQVVTSHSFIRVVRPACHLHTAEENLAFAVAGAKGRFLWLFGDDDILEPGAIVRMRTVLHDQAPDLVVVNPRVLRHGDQSVIHHLLPMRAASLMLSIEQLVVSIGFMGLMACFSTTIVRRARIQGADWGGVIGRAAIYAHVALYLDCLRDARCLLLNEPLVTVRLGSTSLREFQRLAALSEKPVFEPWIGGIPRHFAALAAQGRIASDLLSRVVEYDHLGRFDLARFLLNRVCEQITLWLENDRSGQLLDLPLLHGLAPAVAGGELGPREALRYLVEAQTLAWALDEDGPAHGIYAADVIPLLSTAERDELFAATADWARGCFDRAMDSYRPLTVWDADIITGLRSLVDILAVVAGDRRNNVESQTPDHALATLLSGLPALHGDRLRDLFRDAVRRRVEAARELIDLRRDMADSIAVWPVQGAYRRGRVGCVHLAVRADHRLTPAQLADLNQIDPAGQVPWVLVADNAPALDALIAAQPPALWPAADGEQLGGWTLGTWLGRQIAVPAGAAGPDADLCLTADDRPALRRLVLKAAREARSEYAQLPAARAALAPVGSAVAADYFDAAWYVTTYPDWAADMAPTNPGQEFLTRGSALGRSPGIWFEESWYRSAYPLVEDGIREGAWISGFHHWLALGRRLNLSPLFWFDADFYLSTYPDVIRALESGRYVSAFDHFRQEGLRQGLRPFALFDAQWYANAYREVQEAAVSGMPPFEYFLRAGAAAGHDVGPGFSSQTYLAVNRDVAKSVADGHVPSALYHWWRFGRFEARRGARSLLDS